MKTRLSLLALALVAVLAMTSLTACNPATAVATKLRDAAHQIKLVLGFASPATSVRDPETGRMVDCTVLLHYPDPNPFPAPTGTGWETHILFEPFRTDPVTWNRVCHPQRSIPIVKINQATNSPSILGSSYVPVALKPMTLRWVGGLLPTLRWVGDGYISGRFDVSDLINNYMVGYGA